jgi:M6 family metalloprotease-like protein
MSEFEGLMNQLGYTTSGAGSVRDYFRETSYEQFDLTITLCGVYTAPNNQVYYAGSTSGGGTLRARELARWCAQQVAAEPDIDFSEYDTITTVMWTAFISSLREEGKKPAVVQEQYGRINGALLLRLQKMGKISQSIPARLSCLIIGTIMGLPLLGLFAMK